MTWPSVPLGEVVQLNYGKPLPDSGRTEFGSVPVFGANGVKAYSEQSLHQGPSMIIGRKGSAGEINRASGPFWPLDVTYFTTHDYRRLDFNFLDYALRQMNLPSLAKGVKPGINRNEVYSLPLPLPPLEEQKRIVALLDRAFTAFDRARSLAEANLTDAENLIETVYDSAFTNLPIESVCRQRLGDVCRLINGRAYNKSELLSEGKYRVLRVGNFFTNKSWYFSDLDLEDEKYCVAGDLLYAWSASFGPRIWNEEKVIYHYHIWKVIPDLRKITREFLFHWFEWDKENIKKAQGAGATMIHVSKGSMEERQISVPSLETQLKIVSKLERALAHIQEAVTNYRAQLNQLASLRQSLLQKAIAGELI